MDNFFKSCLQLRRTESFLLIVRLTTRFYICFIVGDVMNNDKTCSRSQNSNGCFIVHVYSLLLVLFVAHSGEINHCITVTTETKSERRFYFKNC